jgi:hypothetical protein
MDCLAGTANQNFRDAGDRVQIAPVSIVLLNYRMLFDEKITRRDGARGRSKSLFGNHAGTNRKLPARSSDDESKYVQVCRNKNSSYFRNQKILLETEET